MSKRFWTRSSTILVLLTVVWATAAVAKQMLPPTRYDGAQPCPSQGANNAALLAWDGENELKCVMGMKVTHFNGDGTGNLLISQHATVTGTATIVGGLVLPKVTPVNPVVGQMWLVVP